MTITLMPTTLKVVPENFSKENDLSILEQNTTPFSFEKDAALLPDQRTIEISKKFKMINLEFLKSRHGGFPKFSVFTLNSNCCFFEAKVDSNNSFTARCNFNSLVIKQQFADIFKIVVEKAFKEKLKGNFGSTTLNMKCKFNGVIPDESRKIIQDEQKNFDEIIIVAEAAKWEFFQKSIPLPYTPDPLVIGIIGNYSFLIHQFNTTTLEKYIAKEFIQ